MRTENKNIALIGWDGASGSSSVIGQMELQQGYAVKMVVVTDGKAAALLATAWPEARIVTDPDEVLNDASIGLVLILEKACLPPGGAGAFIRAGKSVRILNRQLVG